MESYINVGINLISQAHDLYVGTYECIASLTSTLCSKLPSFSSMIPSPLHNISARSTEVLYNAMVATISGTIQLSNQILRRPRNETTMRTCRPEIKELLHKAKGEIITLSKDCSTVFDRTITFTKIPSRGEIQTILDQLYQFKESAGWFSSSQKMEATHRGITTCIQLQEIHERLEEYHGEEISSRDLEAFQQSLSQNVLLTTTTSALIENIGEMVGGAVIDESSPIIPQKWNPAVCLGQKAAECIGRPGGRLIGFMMNMAGIHYLLSKLPLMQFENRRTIIQAGALLSLIAIEYMHLNPLSNYIEDVGGRTAYDLGFYVVSLLFNYLGMYMAGTGESLGSYVRNMTPSMLTYHGTNMAFEMIGYDGIVSGLLSYYLSHVAYNWELYRGLFRGILVESIDFDQMGAMVNYQQIQSARGALTAIVLSNLTYQLTDRSRPFINDAVAESVHSTSQMIFSQNALTTAQPLLSEMNKQAVEELARQLTKIMGQVSKGLQNSLESEIQQSEGAKNLFITLGRLKNDFAYNDVSTFFRECNVFFQFFQSPSMKQLLDSHKREYLTVARESNPNHLNNGQGPHTPFEETRKAILMNILEEFFGPYSEDVAQFFLPVWNGEDPSAKNCVPPQLERFLIRNTQLTPEQMTTIKLVADPRFRLEIDPILLRNNIERLINNASDKLYPLLPQATDEDESCSVYMMELMIRALVIFSTLRLATGQINPTSATEFQKHHRLNFLQQLAQFTLETRFPSGSLFSYLRRMGVLQLIQSQCYLAR